MRFLRFFKDKDGQKGDIKLIVGLGNPGREYQKTRHNLGFVCLNYFARTHGIRLDRKQGGARTGAGEVAGRAVVLARPQTYMNRSGQAVSRLVRSLHIPTENLLVIYDEMDLPLGKIRIRGGGGSGGHNGIKSLTAELGSQDFLRVRVGIGRPPGGRGLNEDDTGVIDYLLSDFTPEEMETITGVLPSVSEAVVYLIEEGLTAAMNKYN